MTPTVRHGLDPDFASEVLEDLYAYRRKRKVVAFAFWVVLGWLGGHRFYLERPVTGLLMLLTGGGALIWWIVDAWRIPVMVREHNAEQARRQEEGRPPLELAFMPPAAPDVLHTPAPWTVKWRQRGRLRRALRFGGDLLVLMVAGSALGSLAGVEGGTEAAFAVVALIAVTL
ncbi:MAG: NINE protein, partial [Gemmatimonadetes bacterium]|nr:TM2 domain-containing protein [Gemmatimonadota bacterium]NIQ54093.1 TM2 domain-containing protein [Gemmatimonadota bacterium]NIU74287.1 NINE protein [Gammaproteobacteria bacterium]NIX44301.1 NINE protein [Gemmatimonadota bacterium]NIY08518.1 NINE protein [Gemmatimonadota bacterium]